MALIQSVTKFLSVLTIVMHALILLFVIRLVFSFITRKKIKIVEDIYGSIKEYSIYIAFLVALTATLGSLFFSEIAKYTPCELCWVQRIFMYPLAIIFLVAILKRDYKVYRYTLPLAIIGGAFSLYHSYISTFQKITTQVCSLTGPSCVVQYFTEFNYVTIPIMALTAFAIIIITSFFMMGKNDK